MLAVSFILGREVKVIDDSEIGSNLMLGNPHLVLIVPGVIRAPDLETDRVFAARFGYENSLHRVRNLGAGDDHDLFRDPFIDQNPVALAHGHTIIFSRSSTAHGLKLPPPISSGNAFAKANAATR